MVKTKQWASSAGQTKAVVRISTTVASPVAILAATSVTIVATKAKTIAAETIAATLSAGALTVAFVADALKRLCGFAAVLLLSISANTSQAHDHDQWQVITKHAGQSVERETNRWNEPVRYSNVVDEQGWYRIAPEQQPQVLVPATESYQQRPTSLSQSTAKRVHANPPGRRSGTLPPSSGVAASMPSRLANRPNSLVPSQVQQRQTRLGTLQHKLPPQTINLDLFVGEVRVMGAVDTTRVAVGNGSIVNAKVIESNELLIIATGVGSTSLRLWNSDATQTDYNIRVSENDPQTRVRLEPMVRMRVRMVEFRKSALGRLGIDWSDSAAGPTWGAAGASSNSASFIPNVEGGSNLVSAATSFSTYFGITSNIASRINFLAQNGDAVTLAEPVLSAVNGGEASFLAGGEVPYPSVGENGQTQVEFKEYGVKLNVAPLIDNAGNVRAKLETEISQLDSSVSVQGAPGLLTRRAQTEVTVRSGETIVISGLLSSESSGDVDMIPLIGRLPIIGRLFSSRSKRNSVSELVIFVTPEVIEPQQAMINAREQRYLQESENRLADLRDRLPLLE